MGGLAFLHFSISDQLMRVMQFCFSSSGRPISKTSKLTVRCVDNVIIFYIIWF